MLAFTEGKDITLTFAPVDELDGVVVATAVRYRVLGMSGVLQDWLDVVGYAGGDVTITIPALTNNIATGAKIEARIVELEYTVEGGSTVLGSVEYTLEAEALLEVGVNSFTTYIHAIAHAAEIDALHDWNNATKRARMGALRRAAKSISQLAFQIRQNNLTIHDEREATVVTNRLYSSPSGIFTIERLDADEFAALPDEFKQSLARAQVIEANALLAGISEEEEYRQKGVLSVSVGESKTFFRTIRPLTTPICRAAMKELARYLYTAKRIGRA